MREQPTRSPTILYVCNNGDKDFSDRYDGEDFSFKVGETIQIPFEAARHIFGYGEADKSRALRRQGVYTHSTDAEKGQKWIDQFVFEMVQPPPPPSLARVKAPELGVIKMDDDERDEGAEGIEGAAEQVRRGRGRPPGSKTVRTAEDVVNGL